MKNLEMGEIEVWHQKNWNPYYSKKIQYIKEKIHRTSSFKSQKN